MKTSRKTANQMKDVLRRDLEGSGLSLEEAATKPLNRDRWKRNVEASCNYNAAGS